MKTKLKRAVPVFAQQTDDERPSWYATGWKPNCVQSQVSKAVLIPAAEYERLTKVDKLAGRLMQHAACITSHKRCSATSDIVDKLMRVASEPTARKQ